MKLEWSYRCMRCDRQVTAHTHEEGWLAMDDHELFPGVRCSGSGQYLGGGDVVFP